MTPQKSSTSLTPAQRARTTLPAVVEKAPAKRAPNRSTRRTVSKKAAASGISLIIADEASKSKQATTVATVLASLGFNDEATGRGETDLAAQMEQYRRYFPARTAVTDILGGDQPDLLGKSEEYRLAWGRVQAEARTILAAKLVAEFGMSEDGAALTAKTRIETDRKNVSVKYRNRLEAQVREQIPTAAGRARFMLAHGFNFSTAVTGDHPCIPVKGSKLVKQDDGSYVLEVPGHEVTKGGAIKALPKPTTPANQQGQGKAGDTIETAAKALTAQFTDHASKHDFVGLLGDAQTILTTILSTTIPESVDQATRARALVDLERVLVRVTQHAGVTPAQYKAARTFKPEAASTEPKLSEEQKAEAFAEKLEAEKAAAAQS